MATLLSVPPMAALRRQAAAAGCMLRTTASASMASHAAACSRNISSSPFDVYDMRRRNPAIKVSKPPKTKARYLTSLKERVEKIEANLAAQPKKRADYKKTLPTKPLNKGILQYIRKNAWEKD